MAMSHVVFDLDDLAMPRERNCLAELLFLKELFPQFKVTLFAIPNYQGRSQEKFFSDIVSHYGDWIQLGIHGWTHDSNFECRDWTIDEADRFISRALEMGCFQPLFKAPGWQISRDTYVVCKNKGIIVADHKESVYTEPGILNKDRRPKHLKVYELGHPWMIHGHTWNCVGNGLPELLEQWKKTRYPFDETSQFHFITELEKMGELR